MNKAINKALLNAVEGQVVEFQKNIELVTAEKLKSKIQEFIKEKEKVTFRNLK